MRARPPRIEINLHLQTMVDRLWLPPPARSPHRIARRRRARCKKIRRAGERRHRRMSGPGRVRRRRRGMQRIKRLRSAGSSGTAASPCAGCSPRDDSTGNGGSPCACSPTRTGRSPCVCSPTRTGRSPCACSSSRTRGSPCACSSSRTGGSPYSCCTPCPRTRAAQGRRKTIKSRGATARSARRLRASLRARGPGIRGAGWRICGRCRSSP